MSQLAFVVNIPKLAQADVGNFIDVGNELVRLVRKDLSTPEGVTLDQVAKTDSFFVAQVVAAQSATTSSPIATKTGKATTITVAGASAGDVTGVTGITAKSKIISVVKVDDTTHAGVDLTSEFTPLAGKINNTGGTSTASTHVVVTWF